ncbi:hypothetical protein C8Q77DRAFT_129142 [Trametes polyzona]|nr:hypothetical protein C8Q77DRAFT_129142 [Trametes polyzona]
MHLPTDVLWCVEYTAAADGLNLESSHDAPRRTGCTATHTLPSYPRAPSPSSKQPVSRVSHHDRTYAPPPANTAARVTSTISPYSPMVFQYSNLDSMMRLMMTSTRCVQGHGLPDASTGTGCAAASTLYGFLGH